MKKILIILPFLFLAFNSFAEEQRISQFEYIMEINKERIEQRQMRITENLNTVRTRGVINLQSPLTFTGVVNVRNIFEDYEKFSIGLIYTEEHRLRILEVLNDEWPEWELEAITQRFLGYSMRYREIDVERIAQTDTVRTEEGILDSLLRHRYEEIRERLKNDTRWRRTFAELASFINDERFVEPLRRVYHEDPEFYGLVLARMGVEPYLSRVETELIAKMQEPNSGRFFNWERMRFMPRTQTLFRQLSEHLLRDDTYDLLGIDDAFHFRRVAQVLFNLLANEEIRDLYTQEERDLFRFPSVQVRREFTKEHARRLYDWMQENYGNYKIRPF
ncbi:MAG: hypothetical protein FWC94_07220 [Bacteroidales bacterium]|nr:hypothetical protein [Bacteroidales bacterium]